MLGKLAFEAVDKPSDLGSLRPKRGNNMRVCHPDMVGWRQADLNADVVALATQYRVDLETESLIDCRDSQIEFALVPKVKRLAAEDLAIHVGGFVPFSKFR